FEAWQEFGESLHDGSVLLAGRRAYRLRWEVRAYLGQSVANCRPMHALLIALASTVIVNAQVADGTGAPLRKESVRITDDRIAAIGTFEPARGDEVIDAKGLVLAPGFIDIHNHSEEGLDRDPLATTQIAQGITTVLLGADGDSPWPIGPWLEQRRDKPVTLNLAVAV